MSYLNWLLQISEPTRDLLKKDGSFNIQVRDTVSPKLPIGMVTYWLLGRKIEGELSTLATIAAGGGEDRDIVSNGSTMTRK